MFILFSFEVFSSVSSFPFISEDDDDVAGTKIIFVHQSLVLGLSQPFHGSWAIMGDMNWSLIYQILLLLLIFSAFVLDAGFFCVFLVEQRNVSCPKVIRKYSKHSFQ